MPRAVSGSWAALALVLTLAAGLRLAGLGWGLFRGTSFHPDEDKILWQLDGMRLGALELDPKDFGWGTLHSYVVGASVLALDRAGVFGAGWRSAFRERREPHFARLVTTGRALSALFGLLTVAGVAAVAREKAGPRAGLVAAALLAVSPIHVVHGHYLTADVALAFWLTSAFLALGRSAPLAGFLAGLALATKPSALPVTAALVALAPGTRSRLLALAAAAGGFLLGEPYALLSFRQWVSASVEQAARIGSATPEAFSLPELLATHAVQTVLYGLGPVATAAAVAGVRSCGRPLAVAAAATAATLVLSRFPMGRYAVPLLPLLAVAAGVAFARLRGRWLALALVAAGGVPLAFSVEWVARLAEPHAYQRAALWIEAQVPAGASLARLWAEYPPLPPGRYRLEMLEDPFRLEGREAALGADVVVLDDLPFHRWRGELLAELARDYRLAARFGTRGEPALPWLPHDSRYPRPAVRVYLRTAYR